MGEDTSPQPTPLKKDRSLNWVLITGFLAFGALATAGMSCGCAGFDPVAGVGSLLAIGWGFYPYFFYRTTKERVAGWIAMGFSLFWLYVSVDENFKYLTPN